MTIGDLVPVEIAGESIGDAVLSEVTEDYVEVVFYGHTIRLAPDVLEFMELRKEVDTWHGGI